MARDLVPASERARLDVRKTYKLYVNGAFPRSESGRSYLVTAANGEPLANAARASRKDLRDAVRAARGAFDGWADRTAMNRGQVLYRVAELLEGRREQFAAEVALAEGLRDAAALAIVDHATDRMVWYAGWADKIPQALGTVNPVAAPYFNFTIPEPTGVVGIVAPESSSLLGLVSRLAPAIVSGNVAVVVTSETRPLPAITLTEVLATSDLPPGVVNVLTGFKGELVPVLAAHADVDGLDLWGVPTDLRTATEVAAAEFAQAPVAPATQRPGRSLRLDRRAGRAASRVDCRLPRDEDGLAPDRDLTWRRSDPSASVPSGRAPAQRVERRSFIQAPPRLVWCALHDPGNTSRLFPELRLGPAEPAWPAAATVRYGRAHLGLLRTEATAESLEARPQSRFRLRVSGPAFDSEWSWHLEPLAGGTRVVHVATFESTDRVAGLLLRLGRESLGERVDAHLRALKSCAEESVRSATSG